MYNILYYSFSPLLWLISRNRNDILKTTRANLQTTVHLFTTDWNFCPYGKTRVTRRPLLPGHVLFSRPKKWQGFQNCPGFCLVGYLCFSGSFTNFCLRPYKFWKGYLSMFHFLAQALTVERTVVGRPPSHCCQMNDNNPPNTIILSLWYDTSPFPIWQH